MKILFIDDETFYMQPYVDDLEEKEADVLKITNAVDGIREIRDNMESNQFDCMILDVMMSPPDGWGARTSNGLFTGVEVLKECQNEVIAVELPVLLLTNQKLEDVKARIDLLKFPKDLVRVHAKLQTRPFFATGIVIELVEKWKRNNNP